MSIIIVNWNAGDQLRECLESVSSSVGTGHRLDQVVVVDNASIDDSLEGLERFGLPLQVCRNLDNRGFSAACNQGARLCHSDLLLFLNPDTVLDLDSLDTSVTSLQGLADERVALLGPRLIDEDGQTARTCARSPRLRNFVWPMTGLDRLSARHFPGVVRTDWDHQLSGPVDHVMGAFFLVRRDVFERLKGFDERYFVYLEDLDFCVRLSEAGWGIHYLASLPVFHQGCGTSDGVRAARLSYATASRLRFAFIHFNGVAALTHLFLTLVLELPARLVQALARRDLKTAGEAVKGFLQIPSAYHRGQRI